MSLRLLFFVLAWSFLIVCGVLFYSNGTAHEIGGCLILSGLSGLASMAMAPRNV